MNPIGLKSLLSILLSLFLSLFSGQGRSINQPQPPKQSEPPTKQESPIIQIHRTKCIWSKSQDSSPLESISCTQSASLPDEIMVHATFPGGRYGDLRFILSESNVSPDGTITGRVMFNGDSGIFHFSADKKLFTAELNNGESVRIIFSK